MAWVWANAGMLAELTVRHAVLSVIPILVSLVVSIPLGYWARTNRAAHGVLLVVSDISYTIPGLALLVLLPVVFGFPILAPYGLEIALSIFGFALMFRSAGDAFGSVAPSVRESALAVGYARTRRFLGVELPLATPVLVAGLRVVSVSTISLATVGSIVGQSTLGDLFLDGFQRQFATEIVTGIVIVIVVAAVFDTAIAQIGRALTPWTRAQRTTRRQRREAAA